jgi:hypothetical protein
MLNHSHAAPHFDDLVCDCSSKTRGGYKLVLIRIALTWRQRVLQGKRVRFREQILALCGEGHHDEEATS